VLEPKLSLEMVEIIKSKPAFLQTPFVLEHRAPEAFGQQALSQLVFLFQTQRLQ
jgi:hypothetical protein